MAAQTWVVVNVRPRAAVCALYGQIRAELSESAPWLAIAYVVCKDHDMTMTLTDTFTLVEWSRDRWYTIQNENRADWDSSDIGTRAESVAWMKARGGLVKHARIVTA